MSDDNWQSLGSITKKIVEKIEPSRLTPEQESKALELRSRKVGWRRIAASVGTSMWNLRMQIDPDFKLMESARWKQNWHLRQSGRSSCGHTAKLTIPPDVEAERSRAYDPNPTANMVLCGDPRPGRSALDKKINW